MSLIEKIQGRRHVVNLLLGGDVSTWPEIMDRIELAVNSSGDGDDQKRYSDGFISGALSSIRNIRDRIKAVKDKVEASMDAEAANV